ncbi:DUF4012 domain-containing protein [Gordonia sp. VNK1]|uniref:DUF4012 domain-containing protein n=1 Tax=Gordonia oleivorans TaxID=3156618 RepID=UPI0032B4E2E5
MSDSLDRPSTVLFICTGNICRSPMGERILRAMAARGDVDVTVTSAGVGAQNAQPMHPLSAQVLGERGYDADGFESRYLRPQILETADLVLTMTRKHRAACQRMLPARWKRMFTLTEFVELRKVLGDDAPLQEFIDSRGRVDTNSASLDIVDPMGQPIEAFERVFSEIEPKVGEVAEWLGVPADRIEISDAAPAGSDAIDPAPTGREAPSAGRVGRRNEGRVEATSLHGDNGTPPPPAGRGGNERSEEPSRDHRKSKRKLWITLAIVLALLILAILWLAFSAFKAKGELEAAKTDAQQAKTLILKGDESGAQKAAQSAADEASSAADRTHGIVWSMAAAIPWLGDPLESVQQMSDAVSDYASDVLVPSAELASVLSPSQLRTGDTINTAPLQQAQPELAALAKRSNEITAQAQPIDPSWLGTVADARDQLIDVIDRADATIDGTNVAAQLVPGMLGGDGPRNYFLALQTPSEARGTGGLVGGFAIVNATDGRVTTPTLGANNQFRDPARPQIDLGDEYNLLYSQFHPYTDFRNGNIDADFRDAARIWIANWESQNGRQLDGAIAVDPIAMSYVLKVTGPVTLPNGEKITADNIVPITLSTSYERFANNNDARKAYLQTISRAIVDQVSRFDGDTGDLLEALGQGVHERRIMVYSTDPQEQAVLETTDLGHQISDTDSPYLQVALGNAGGNKLDYYLRRDISYVSGQCTGDTRESTVTVKLTNTLTDLSLPDYVIAPNGTDLGVERGTNLVNVEMLTTKGATLKSLTVDGEQALRIDQALHGRPYMATMVQVPPGQTVTVEMTMEEPTSAHGAAEVPIQPLVDDPNVRVDVPVCG